MVRLAFSNDFKLHTFYSGLLGYKGPIWNRDIDRHPSEDLLLSLHRHTGQPIPRLQQLALNSYSGILFDALPAFGNAKWILPVGIFHRERRRAGMQFCPLCLQSDAVPFYRKQWRLGLYVLCVVHQCVIEQNCASCGKPIAYHRHGVGRQKAILEQALLFCAHCGFDLRLTGPAYFHSPDEKLHRRLISIISASEEDIWDCGGLTPPFSIPFFRGVHTLLGMLMGRHAKRIVPYLSASSGIHIRPFERRHAEFELLSASDRLGLVLMVAWMLVDWPGRFIEACRRGRLTRSRVSDDVELLPYWLASVVDEFLDNRIYLPSDREAAEAAKYLRSQGLKVTANALGKILGLGPDCARRAQRKLRLG
jgi:hypothetical protein